jgi:hypothetical protein
MKPILRPHIENLLDNVDAAVFTGDQFFEKHARAEFRRLMARWEKELKTYDELPHEEPEDRGVERG